MFSRKLENLFHHFRWSSLGMAFMNRGQVYQPLGTMSLETPFSFVKAGRIHPESAASLTDILQGLGQLKYR
ncbi:MAG: hypothetical protein DRP79_09645 [Planctomycetota bacterium]|nr:MAG: hypothetical protein DRP79_09645 [Planctomycetota bacterium]